jgi:perosamine synthetase
MSNRLAIDGGEPARSTLLPYSRQSLDEEDIHAVVEVLRSDWLTTGPKVPEFEEAFANFVGSSHAVAVSSGTAALHAAVFAAGIGPGDEVIVPPMTFAATANAVVFQGGKPVFADVDADTLLIDPAKAESKINPRTKAIIAVDYAGQPCDYDSLRTIAERHRLTLIADACHALGATYKGQKVGALADLNVFSFHPVKHITTGEGGMITTDNLKFAEWMEVFRNHGITSDHHQREKQGSWFYEMVELGYNYRLTDFQCALGISQLLKLPKWVSRRQKIAEHYDKAFQDIEGIQPLKIRSDVSHAYHLYVIRLDQTKLGKGRSKIFKEFRANGIGVNVHYIPVHLHPYYRKKFETHIGLCPIAEQAYEGILSLPMFAGLSDEEVEKVIATVRNILTHQ